MSDNRIKMYTVAYNKEVTPKRKKQLEKDLEKFSTIDEKIEFLNKSYYDYLKNVPPEILHVSGSVNLPNFNKGEPLFWDRYLLIRLDELKKQLPKKVTNKKENKLSAPVIRRFCELVNDSGVKIRGEENAEKYCESVCKQFKLKYTVRVSKYFQKNNKPTKNDKHLQVVKESILTNIPLTEREKIELYINNHLKLYA